MPKKKSINEGKYRIIKIGKDALWEYIYESVIANQGDFFDISDVTQITSHHDIDFESGEYICLIHKDNDTLKLPPEIDLSKLLKNMDDTTDTLFQTNRYVELSLDEIKLIQTKD